MARARTLLVIVPLLVLLTVALLLLLEVALLTDPGPVPSLETTASPEVRSPPNEVPPPRFNIRPTQCPISFTITRMALSPKTLVSNRLNKLELVSAVPVVAEPAAVLPLTLAAPLVAVALMLLLNVPLLVLLTVALSLLLAVALLVEPGPVLLLLTAAPLGELPVAPLKLRPGKRMSPSRSPYMLSIPKNDCPEPIAELIRLTMLSSALASPLMALPPLVLPPTFALPDWANRSTLLFIEPLDRLLTLILLLQLVVALLVEPAPVLLLESSPPTHAPKLPAAPAAPPAFKLTSPTW